MSTTRTRILPVLAAALALVFAGASLAAEPVDINAASAEELAEAIRGVGLKRAEAIVAHRERNGPFRSVDELVEVSGIGEKTLEASRQNLTVGAPAE